MLTAGAARRKNGSRTLDAAATAPSRTLGVGAAAAAVAAAAPTGPSFGPGSLGRGVGLRPPPRFSGRVGGSVAATTTWFDAAGGDFPGLSASQPWFDAAGGDPSSPGSWRGFSAIIEFQF
uniref:Uncharacterized protein n=1 Tax=Leersia perrieri TaxID=77586 RepID=A0A0D9W3T2_9ORYZ